MVCELASFKLSARDRHLPRPAIRQEAMKAWTLSRIAKPSAVTVSPAVPVLAHTNPVALILLARVFCDRDGDEAGRVKRLELEGGDEFLGIAVARGERPNELCELGDLGMEGLAVEHAAGDFLALALRHLGSVAAALVTAQPAEVR